MKGSTVDRIMAAKMIMLWVPPNCEMPKNVAMVFGKLVNVVMIVR